MSKIPKLISLLLLILCVANADLVKSENHSRGRVSFHVNYTEDKVPTLLLIEIDNHQVYSLILKNEGKDYGSHFSAIHLQDLEISVTWGLRSGAPKSLDIVVDDRFVDGIEWDSKLGYRFICKRELDRILELSKNNGSSEINF